MHHTTGLKNRLKLFLTLLSTIYVECNKLWIKVFKVKCIFIVWSTEGIIAYHPTDNGFRLGPKENIFFVNKMWLPAALQIPLMR